MSRLNEPPTSAAFVRVLVRCLVEAWRRSRSLSLSLYLFFSPYSSFPVSSTCSDTDRHWLPSSLSSPAPASGARNTRQQPYTPTPTRIGKQFLPSSRDSKQKAIIKTTYLFTLKIPLVTEQLPFGSRLFPIFRGNHRIYVTLIITRRPWRFTAF